MFAEVDSQLVVGFGKYILRFAAPIAKLEVVLYGHNFFLYFHLFIF